MKQRQEAEFGRWDFAKGLTVEMRRRLETGHAAVHKDNG